MAGATWTLAVKALRNKAVHLSRPTLLTRRIVLQKCSAQIQGREQIENKDRRDCRLNEVITHFKKLGQGLCFQHFLSFYFIVIWRESGSLQVKNKPPGVTWPSQTVWVHYTRQTVASCVVNGSQREWSIKCLNLYGINRQRSSVWVGWGSSDWYQLKLQYLSIYTDFSLFIDLFWISLKNPVLVRAVDWQESDDTIRITTRVIIKFIAIYYGADAQACLCFH